MDWKGLSIFGYGLGALCGFGEHKPGRTNLFKLFREAREKQLAEMPVDIAESLTGARGGIGTPDDMRGHLKKFEKVGVDQVTFIQQECMNKHEHICESLELFTSEVMPEFKAREAEREAKKTEELLPYIKAALARKKLALMPYENTSLYFRHLNEVLLRVKSIKNKA